MIDFLLSDSGREVMAAAIGLAISLFGLANKAKIIHKIGSVLVILGNALIKASGIKE